MTNDTKNASCIRTHEVPVCPLCGSAGRDLYSDLKDHLFAAPGVWGSRQCTNVECGLVWLDPAPIEEDLHLAYARYYTHKGDEPAGKSSYRGRSAWQGYRSLAFGNDRFPATIKQKILGSLFFLLPNRKPAVEYPLRQTQGMPIGKVLEIGCGAGDMLYSLKEQGWQTVGIDFDLGAVEAAKGKGLDVRLGDLSAQAFADASFDLVLMNHVIEHLPNPIGTLCEIKRLLRSGGRLVGITPNAESWGHHHFAQNWRGLEPPRHLQIFTKKSLRNMLEFNGYARAEVKVSVMSAIQILKESIQLSSRGEKTNSLGIRIYLEFVWMWEWAMTLIGKSNGEILIFKAEK